MPYLNRLIALKQERNITNAEIAKLSNIPLATVTRIFNGQTPNPTFETFTQIAIALGASLDEIAGLKQPETPPVDAHIENTLNTYVELLRDKDDRIKELKAEKEQERKEKMRILTFTFVFILAAMAFLIFDLLNGHIGYFTY